MSLTIVREYATLTTEEGPSSLDRATIPTRAFAWLAEHACRSSDRGRRLAEVTGPNSLRLLNLVGVMRTPCGTQIEILPKHTHGAQDAAASRRLLIRLVAESASVAPRVADPADLEVLNRPITEWIARAFVRAVGSLLERGLRSDYQRVEAREQFLRGRLDVGRQLRAGPGAGVTFHVRHDVFTLNRPENRLIRLAVDRVTALTRDSETWRLARELSTMLSEIPPSADIRNDLAQWSDDRLLCHYAATRPLCKLILMDRTPFTTHGAYSAPSMLFPMEKLFEAFVERSLRKQLPKDVRIQTQSRSQHLARTAGTEWFELQPDFVMRNGECSWVADAKWKILTPNPSDKYGLSQSDFYQLNAYGQTYLGGNGDLILIYPKTRDFPNISAPFHMRPHLRVHVIPIDLETGYLALPQLTSLKAADSTHLA